MAGSKDAMQRKVGLCWKKWNDSAVKQAEKDTIKPVIEKVLNDLNMDIDWKTGKLTDRKPAGSKGKEETKGKEAGKKKDAGGWSTSDLASYLSSLLGKEVTAKTLRRHLRSMDRYNDKVMTHYSWTGQNDPLVKEIVDSFTGKSSKKQSA